MEEITLPTIHLNGTSKKDLIEGYENAFLKINDAVEEVNKIQFHSRDYYPQGNDAWNKAVEERINMKKKLKEVEDYILKHLTHLIDP